jgi:dTDP-glucose 4,6-dehydratase
LIDGIMRLSKSGEHDPVNIGNPNEWTILECAHEVQALIGSQCEIAFRPLPRDDPKQRQPDITRAKTVLGWEPKVQLREGLARSLDYFRAAVEAEKAQPRTRAAAALQDEEYFRLASGR